ncbi:unnamed protein product [Didymodactylos carnosus]|uniref:ATP-dependent RNA helicase n=1 Tax=Didymodactylos carnosus TaxID=1234261 RepID=A0A8S2MLC8_9BILA|nr:unnamed protein product [Didymodactylos carnosus]CAF3964502.1 unnamed protein product [Didymodactylos carnosus]
MAGTGDEKQLKRCVTAIIEAVQESITKLQPQQQTSNPDTLLTNSTLNYNINTFTVNVEEDELIDTLTTRIESILNQYIPYLTQTCQKYLLHFLHQYHYDQDERKFNDSLTLNDLHPFLRELQGVLASVDAFLAAWEGKLSSVRDFIKAYPTFKDKPGLWGTTLLYSTAKNNHMSLVEYLVTSAHCSVNTQNQQHLEKALSASIITAKDFTVSPTAASTALHGACFNGHLEIVKYLIKHGADYFIKNHAQETPIMNGESRPEIKQFFQDFLIPGYSRSLNNFPDEPILEEPILARSGQQEVDCVWEYKPFLDQKWFKFPASESSEIHQSLIVAPDQQFKSEVHLRVRQGVYSVSTIQFIRSGKDLDQQNLAWVRCRGSSILNFDIYSLWQMMFMKHPQADQSASPSLKNFDIPTIYDSEFKIQLNSWYNCDAKTNSRLDHAMNYRQKIIPLDLDFITDDEVKFNLHEFTFTNDQKSVLGFIRWIPKLISNNEQNKNKITNIDNFQTLTNLNPIPLTRRHLNEVLQASNTSTTEEQLTEDINEDDSTLQSMSNEDDDTDTLENRNKTTQSSDSGIWSISDSTNNDDTVPFNTVSTLQQQTVLTTTSKITTDGKSDDSLSDLKINDYFNETVAMARPAQQSSLLERSDSSLNLQATAALTAQLEEENKELKAKLAAETASVQEQLNLNVQRTAEQERRLAEAMEEIDRMHTEQKKMEEKEAKIQQIAKTIKTIEYNNIPTQIIHDFITPKFNLVLDWLRKTKKLDEFFYDKIPKMTFREQNNTYTVTISGFQVHHDSFKAVLNRISTLSNVTQSAKDFYQRHLNRLTRAITNALFQVNSRTRNWRNYAKCLVQLLQEKNTEHSKLFNDYINQKSKILTEQSISDSSTKPWIELKTQTNNFMKQYPFVNEIETLKHQALEEFIKQNISFQRLKLDKKPTEKSISVVKDFIEKVKAVFKTNAEYTGHELKHFSLIPELLQRIMIYYCCFLIQLPLYESAKELLEKIEKNTVITIATSTGSGKSTLLPALLIAEGYDKVIVTQPRRLPCTLISKRVNETMRTETGSLSEKLAGWAVSGAQGNPKAKILYLTDGLLKERLLYDENFITTQTRLNKSIVFFIDEVHERSVNIDLCLALLARLLSLKPELKSKLKVIISSATLDASVPTLYRNIQQLRFDEFTMPAMGTLHTVIKLPRPNENIVDIVLELCKKRQRHDQILCFVNSVSDVNQCCRLLAEISRGTIIAYPLIQSQSSAVQQQNIEHGSIFFSTTVAETSLTFPSLKYVVDTGMINIPVYDLQSKQTVLKEVRAAESTIKQRLGRLGRTKPGEYYSLYDFKVEDKRFPTPQICQSDLMNIEFSLRKSPLKNGLNYLAAFLPDKPSPQAINMTVNELRKLSTYYLVIP